MGRALAAILALLLWCGAGFLPIAGAAKLPFIEDVLRGGKSANSSVEQPEPAALGAEWWHYFDVKGPKLDERIQSSLERLETLVNSLPEGVAEAAQGQWELIRANLLALPKARAQASAELPPPLVYGENYTIKRFLEIAESGRNTQAKLENEKDDVMEAEKSIKAAIQRIDTLVAAYLGLPPDDPERVLRGLEIMAERSSAAVAEARLRVLKATLLSNEARFKQLTDEQGVAIERLTAEPTDLIALNIAIEQAQEKFDKAKAQLLSEQSRALTVLGDSAEDRATARYRHQRVVRAAVVEAIETVRLLKFQAESQLSSFLLDVIDMEVKTMEAMLTEWKAKLADIRQQAVIWGTDSERERGRAAESIATAGDGAKLTTPSQLINEERLRLAQETLVTLQHLDDEITQGELLIQLINEQLARREGGLRSLLITTEQAFKQIGDKTTGWISASLFKIGDTPVTALGLLRIVLIITIAWSISYWLRRALKRMIGKRRGNIDEGALYTVGRLSHYLIICLGFIVGLSSIGIDFTNFALVAGAMAIGLGFGLQSIVNNFVSGLILLFERSLKVGDFIELASGVAGEVREINVRSTLINTNDNVDIVVPNSEFMNTNVTNWTLVEGHCRIHLPFKVAYGSDKELVKKAGLEAACNLPHTLTGIPGKNPGVWLVQFGDSGLDFELVVWITPSAVKRPGAVHAAYMWEIDSALRKHGIEIPIPKRELRLREGFDEALGRIGHHP